MNQLDVEVEALKARVAELEGERDDARQCLGTAIDSAGEHWNNLKEARARVAMLREALLRARNRTLASVAYTEFENPNDTRPLKGARAQSIAIVRAKARTDIQTADAALAATAPEGGGK